MITAALQPKIGPLKKDTHRVIGTIGEPLLLDKSLESNEEVEWQITSAFTAPWDQLDGLVVSGSFASQIFAADLARQHGIPIFLSLPFAPSSIEAFRVIEQYKEAQLLCGVDWVFRELPEIQLLRSLLDDEDLGNLESMHLSVETFSTSRHPGEIGDEMGALRSATPALDAVLAAMGFPKVSRVSASLMAQGQAVLIRDRREDAASGNVQFQSGPSMSVSCVCRTGEQKGQSVGLVIQGTQASARLKISSQRSILELSSGATFERVIESHRALPFRSWLAQLEDGYHPQVETVLPSVRLVDALYAAAVA